MGNVLETMAGSVSRSVYSHLRRHGCTLFAQADGRQRTVVVRNGVGIGGKRLAAATKGLNSVGSGEMASFLLSR